MFNDALFAADGIVKCELIRVSARHGSTASVIVTLLLLVSEVASSNLANGMRVSMQSLSFVFYLFNLALSSLFLPVSLSPFVFKAFSIIAGGQWYRLHV
jgi:hypothetical protein